MIEYIVDMWNLQLDSAIVLNLINFYYLLLHYSSEKTSLFAVIHLICDT